MHTTKITTPAGTTTYTLKETNGQWVIVNTHFEPDPTYKPSSEFLPDGRPIHPTVQPALPLPATDESLSMLEARLRKLHNEAYHSK